MASTSPRCAGAVSAIDATRAATAASPRILRPAVWLLPVLLIACSTADPGHAEIEQVRPLRSGGVAVLEVQQRLDFSPRMLDALSHGIGLRLDYRVQACDDDVDEIQSLWLRYFPLANEFEMRWQGQPNARRFARRSALLAALDQVQMPLPERAMGCAGRISMRLEPAALPAPLRFPALIGLQDWRMYAAPVDYLPLSVRE